MITKENSELVLALVFLGLTILAIYEVNYQRKQKKKGR